MLHHIYWLFFESFSFFPRHKPFKWVFFYKKFENFLLKILSICLIRRLRFPVIFLQNYLVSLVPKAQTIFFHKIFSWTCLIKDNTQSGQNNYWKVAWALAYFCLTQSVANRAPNLKLLCFFFRKTCNFYPRIFG